MAYIVLDFLWPILFWIKIYDELSKTSDYQDFFNEDIYYKQTHKNTF